MKTRSETSAYIVRSGAAALLLSCVVVALCSAINLPNHPPKSPTPDHSTAFGVNAHESVPSMATSTLGSNRTLSFAERVAYQRAIEDVYWRHRIWPKERTDPKPSLDAVMSQAQLENKVTDYLRKSQALEDYWQRPLTAGQLQAEMDRMAKHTKQPEVLHELSEALGNDPFVIAECLGRPALAERLLTNWYAYDQRIHGDLKQRAEAELGPHPALAQMKQLSGNYSEIEFYKTDGPEEPANRHPRHGITLNGREWNEAVEKLACDFGVRRDLAAFQSADVSAHSENSVARANTPIGSLSLLQEDETSFYVTAIISRTDEYLKLATVSWSKEPVELWLGRVESQAAAATASPGSNYTLPQIAGGGCIDDTWTATNGPPYGRYGHTAVWTGTEMIVWGGRRSPSPRYNTGGRYNPSTDSWIATTVINAPAARDSHTAVWTGSEMVIWGGYGDSGELNTGAGYNPSTDSWIATSTTNAPTARASHTAIWTGGEMIVWGGWNGPDGLNSGGRYNPVADSWTATSATNAPAARYYHTAVWIGSEMIVWGGYDEFNNFNTGGSYNPSTDSWAATNITDAPSARFYHTALWTGAEMIVWGGGDFLDNQFNTGGKYDPEMDSWTATSTASAPLARRQHTTVWTGSEMVVWGGYDGSNYLNTGARYCAQSGPTPTPTASPTPTPSVTASATPRFTPTPRPRPTPAPRPTP